MVMAAELTSLQRASLDGYGAEGERFVPAPPATPERSLNQRMEALARANEVRSARARLKRDLKAGRCAIDALLLAPPEYLETAKVFDMLLAVPKYGRVKVNKMLLGCRISSSKTIGGLSERQRAELIALLRR
jgi:S13-like H2TH domain